MTGLSNRLQNLCNLADSEVSHYALMVDKDAHELIIRLTKALCLQVDLICCAYPTDVMILVVSSKSDGLSIFTIFLNPECDFQFFWCNTSYFE
jgi:hypothetical protein